MSICQEVYSNLVPSAHQPSTSSTSSTSAPPCPAGLGSFQFVQEYLETAATSTTSTPDVTAELTGYLQHIPYATENAYQWWHDHSSVYPRLYELALGVLSTPASEAYVERIFQCLVTWVPEREIGLKWALRSEYSWNWTKNCGHCHLLRKNEHYKQASHGSFLPDDINWNWNWKLPSV